MPPMSTIQTFINALRTGQTRTTLALDELFATPGQLKSSLTPGQVDTLRSPGGFNTLADWMRDLLRAVSDPLTGEELNHIDQWPSAHKEQLRATFLRSFDDDRSVWFFWEIYSGAAPDTVIRDLGQLGIVVTFRSPRSRVRLEGDASGSVFVAS